MHTILKWSSRSSYIFTADDRSEGNRPSIGGLFVCVCAYILDFKIHMFEKLHLLSYSTGHNLCLLHACACMQETKVVAGTVYGYTGIAIISDLS